MLTHKTCYFSGGNVTFALKNDAPTLTGAKAGFTINLNFPSNQTVLPGGEVVWANNCTVDGRKPSYQGGFKVEALASTRDIILAT